MATLDYMLMFVVLFVYSRIVPCGYTGLHAYVCCVVCLLQDCALWHMRCLYIHQKLLDQRVHSLWESLDAILSECAGMCTE